MNESSQSPFLLLRRIAQLVQAVVLAAAVVAPASAFAASPKMSAADQQEIQQFQLNDDFLHRYEAAVADAHQHEAPAQTDSNPEEAKAALASLSSLDAMTANITRSPAETAVLQRHGLKPREVVVGGLALMRAEMADTMLANPQMARYVDKSNMPSAANLAFYRAHKSEIRKIIGGDTN